MSSSRTSLKDITSRLFIFLFITFFIGLSACSNGDAVVDTSATNNKGGVQLPRALKTNLPANGNLAAYITVDGGERQLMTIDGDRANLRITGLSQGPHTFVVVFEFILDINTVEPLVVSRAVKDLSIGAGNNTLNILDTDYISAFDDDNDGKTNLVELANNTNPFAGFKITPVTANTTEAGDSARFSVVLTRRPDSDVTLSVSSTDLNEGVPDQITLVFTADNWNVPQEITVSGVSDNVADGNASYGIKLDNVSSNDSNYNGQLIDNVAVLNIDNDSAGFNVSPISKNTLENGVASTFSVRLSKRPTADVTLNLNSSNTAEGTIDKVSLRFTPNNWNTAHIVSVSGQGDGILDGDQAYRIEFSAAESTDASYNGLTPPAVKLINLDSNGILLASFVMPSQSVVESNDTVGFAVTLSNVSSREISIPFTVSGTADAQDHTLLSGEILIPAGDTLGSTRFNLINDTQREPTETIIITLGEPVNAAQGAIITHTVSIINNDYTVGGNVTGLTGGILILSNNQGNNLSITADGSFTFSNALNDGQPYNVITSTQPTNQTCVIQNSGGSLSSNNITDLIINCIANDLLKPKPRSTRVTFNITDVGADSYNIYYSTTKGFDSNNIASAANGQSITNITAGTDVIANNLKNGTAYYFVLEMVFGAETVQLPEASSRPNEWVFGERGGVNTMGTSTDGTLFVGGSFTSVGFNTGGAVPFSAKKSDFFYGDFPIVNGAVFAIEPDEKGGWYIGGLFNKVGGIVRNNIVHILADNTIDSSWKPNIDRSVTAIAINNGIVYVGGSFTTVDGLGRNSLAAISETGLVTAWDPDIKFSTTVKVEIYDLIINNGIVYFGGLFNTVGNVTRNNIAAVNLTNGLVTGWNPGANNRVRALAISGNVLYAGGAFGIVGGSARNRLAAIDLNGAVTNWNPTADSTVLTLKISNGKVYVGGFFSNISGISRASIAAIAMDATGTLDLNWNPGKNGFMQEVNILAISGNEVFAGGHVNTRRNPNGERVVRILSNGLIDQNYSLNLTDDVWAIAINKNVVYVGGEYDYISIAKREGLAAINPDQTLSVWNPSPNGRVNTLVVDGSQIYIGGSFSIVGEVARNNLASISTDTSRITVNRWNPDANNVVFTLIVDGTTVYAGGDFTFIGGEVRNRLASIENGVLGRWNPDADKFVNTLAISGTGTSATIYAGGLFITIGGITRNRLAAIGADGTLTTWDPDANGQVRTLSVNGTTVYIGGTFSLLDSTAAIPITRNRLAAIGTDGVISSWNPDVSAVGNDAINALSINNNTVYVGGGFSTIGGVARKGVAAIEVNGVLSNIWQPDLPFSINEITISGSTIYLGGSGFAKVGTDGVIR